TKLFAYAPSQHFLLPEDREIFELLGSIQKNEKIYDGYHVYHYRGNVSDKRSIVVPPLIAEQLLEKLIQRDLVVEANSKSYSNVSIEKGKLPFHFALNKNERDDLLLTMHEVEDSVYFSNYEMLFYNGLFYFPLKEQIPILELVSQF